jgi:hypothetical protein
MNVHITVQAVLEDIEAGALFLLTHGMRRLRVVGLRTLRTLSKSVEQMSRDPDSHPGMLHRHLLHSFLIRGSCPEVLRATIDAISWIDDIVQGRDSVLALLEDEDHLLDREVRARLKFWRENRPSEWVQRLAETEDETDRGIWPFSCRSSFALAFPSNPALSLFSGKPSLVLSCGITRRLRPSQESAVKVVLWPLPSTGLLHKLPNRKLQRTMPTVVHQSRARDPLSSSGRHGLLSYVQRQ